MNLFVFVCVLVCCVCSVWCHPTSKNSEYKFPFYTREDWEGLPPKGAEALSVPVPYVVIHHTYIPASCTTTEQCMKDMRSMQAFHNSKGWGDIGYNFCVGSEGGAYEGRGWRSRGIHAGRANSHSVGICLIGDWRVNVPPQIQLDTTKALIAAGVERGFISPEYKLIGHNQAMNTECPGEALSQEISKWNHYSPNGFELNKI